MIIRLTQDDINRAKRILQDPFENGEFRYVIYPRQIRNDDGLFKHGDDFVPCHGCQPDPTTGESTWSHGHIVVEGSNGGIRCEPLTDESLRAIARDDLDVAPAKSAIRIGDHDELGVRGVVLALTDGLSRTEVKLRVTPTAEKYLEGGDLEALDVLIKRGLLFADIDNDD